MRSQDDQGIGIKEAAVFFQTSDDGRDPEEVLLLRFCIEEMASSKQAGE
jgi:hypothetical protein